MPFNYYQDSELFGADDLEALENNLINADNDENDDDVDSDIELIENAIESCKNDF